MEFKKVLKDILNKQRRRAGSKAYIRNGELYLSRIFGYQLVEGIYIPDPRYELVIRIIFEMLASGASLPSIKTKLDGMKARDSSRNPFGASRIQAIGGRLTYAGFVKQGVKLIRIKNMEPIISLETWKKAQKTLYKERRNLVANA